jgi:hypothetical protein
MSATRYKIGARVRFYSVFLRDNHNYSVWHNGRIEQVDRRKSVLGFGHKPFIKILVRCDFNNNIYSVSKKNIHFIN